MFSNVEEHERLRKVEWWEDWELIVNLRLGVSSWFSGFERILRDEEEILGFCWGIYGSKPRIRFKIPLFKCKPKKAWSEVREVG